MSWGRQRTKMVTESTDNKMSKESSAESSFSERPISRRPRRLAEWLNVTGERKVHSLIDKVYSRKNLECAWAKVRRNGGAGGVDNESIEEFEQSLETNLESLHQELRDGSYSPSPVREKLIPKGHEVGRFRALGIPTIRDRVCHQALLNRLEAIFDPVFDDASFGYRKERSTKDALKKVWKELQEGREWIVDADLKDFFGSADHEKVLTLVNQRVSDGKVLALLRKILKAGSMREGKILPTEQGAAQGSGISPLLSNILLTPFDREMRSRGYKITRWADDWIATCRTRAEAKAVLRAAKSVLGRLGVTLHPEKTRIIHVRHGFEFLGFKIKRGSKPLTLTEGKIKTNTKHGNMYAYPREKSIENFKEQIRALTSRKASVSTEKLIEQINPVIRGWGNYYCKSHVRKLFKRLDGWIVARIRAHRVKRWRNVAYRQLPERMLYHDLKLVRLAALIPSLKPRFASS